jgi:integrase
MHSLRKSCITDWANGGVAPKSVQEWAGHADIRTTMAYYAKVVDSEFEKISGVTQKQEAGSKEHLEPASQDHAE